MTNYVAKPAVGVVSMSVPLSLIGVIMYGHTHL